ncbi:class I SAM-dependent methyltransferase [Thermosyntropha sp.]|uniref:class I SAM-dependent methyltransferase n=1 Tax=Thermosyntropha sp. TaxID=2740820 RepID=UPI0025DDD659|nr:class I SAM-dependent methyltransferase [Thermosyntropha sp.]MBO8158381.1 class I SAM-dependent methyltransferase [Thermosyntropha sp.]
MRVIATTTQSKAASSLTEEFCDFLGETGIKFVPRKGKSLEKLKREHNADGVIVWKDTGPVLYIDENVEFFYHPSMAKNRISNYRKFGTFDPLIKAFDLREDDEVLDCTLGLGSDAVVASYFAPRGRVVGLEYSMVAAALVKWGMKMYKSPMQWLNQAIKRIEVLNEDYRVYLKKLADNSFDIVYFDPMFRKPVLRSQPISPLRFLANPEPVDRESIKEAVRVARKRVVMKEIFSSGEFARLGFEKICGNPNNKIAYGVIEKKGI